MIHGNGKYIAYQKQGGGGGSIEVFDDSLLMDLENDSVKMDTDNPKCIGGHKGGSDDFQWCPFNDDVLATAGNDGLVKVTDYTNS